MAEEKIYTIPLRRELLKVPRYQRLTKAVRATRSFLVKHVKEENISMGQQLNQKLHERGRKNPPARIKVKVYKFKEGWIADLVDAPLMKEEEKPKKGITEKVKETITGKKAEVKEEIKESKEQKEEEEKKGVLEHPPAQKGKKREAAEKVPKERKAGEQERKKEIFSKTQKPKHEKRK